RLSVSGLVFNPRIRSFSPPFRHRRPATRSRVVQNQEACASIAPKSPQGIAESRPRHSRKTISTRSSLLDREVAYPRGFAFECGPMTARAQETDREFADCMSRLMQRVVRQSHTGYGDD